LYWIFAVVGLIHLEIRSYWRNQEAFPAAT
jgi:hypothetical protein